MLLCAIFTARCEHLPVSSRYQKSKYVFQTKSQFVDILFDAFAKVFVKAAMFMIVPCYPWHRLKGEKMSVKGEDDDSIIFVSWSRIFTRDCGNLFC